MTLRQIRRQAIYQKYGNKCNCCGETDSRFFTLDHVNNDGKHHRAQLIDTKQSIETWIINNNFPDSIQILCINCNYGRQWNKGICPHKLEVTVEKVEFIPSYVCIYCNTRIYNADPNIELATPCTKCVETSNLSLSVQVYKSKVNKEVRKRQKYCPLCDKWFLKLRFNVDKTTLDGLQDYCKACDNERRHRFKQVQPRKLLNDLVV